MAGTRTTPGIDPHSMTSDPASPPPFRPPDRSGGTSPAPGHAASARRRGASPFRYLTPDGRRALYLLGFLAAVKALALVLIAQAVASGVVSIIDESDAWRRAIFLGMLGGLIRALASWTTDVVAARTASAARTDLRLRLARRITARGGRDLDTKVGETATLATTGLDALDGWYSSVLPAVVNAVTIPLLLWARILWADWVSALIILLTVPLIPIFMVLIGYRTQAKVAEAAETLGWLSNQLVELARGLPVLVGLGRADAQITGLREISENYRRRTMETLRVAFLSSLALELIATLSVAIVAVFIGIRLVYGDLDLLTGLLVLILAPECYLPFREIGMAFHASEDGIESMERVETIVSTPVAVLPGESPRVETPLSPSAISSRLMVSDLWVHYGDRSTPAVDGLSFAVEPGEIVALSGPSGSGKSTALAAIAGLLGTTANGSVTVTGTISGADLSSIAWVPQHPEMFANTVREEVALYAGTPPPICHSERSEESLSSTFSQTVSLGTQSKVGTHRLLPLTTNQVADSRSRDVATPAAAGRSVVPQDAKRVEGILAEVGAGHLIDRHSAELSPGELRRVAMARALARIEDGATLLLLDEPTAHLDPATAAVMLRLIAKLRGRVTIVLVAHDPTVRELADRVIPVSPFAETEVAEPDATVPGPLATEDPKRRAMASPTPEEPEMLGTLRDLREVLRPTGRGFIAAVAWGTLAMLAGVALISVSGWLIVRASQQPPIFTLLVAIVGVRFFGIARSGFRYLERLRMHDAMFAAMTELRVGTWRRLAAQGPAIARLLRGDRALDLMIGDIDQVRDLTPRVVLPPVVGAVTALILTAVLGWLLPAAIAPMVVCTLICLLLAPFVAVRTSASAAEGQLELRSRIMRIVASLFSAAPDLHVNGVDNRVLTELDRLDRQSDQVARRTARALGLGNAIVIFACTATAMAMLWVARDALGQGVISPQVCAVLVLTPLALIDPFLATCDAAQQWPALQRALGRLRADASPLTYVFPVTTPDLPEELQPADAERVSTLAIDNLAARWPGDRHEVFAGLTATTGPNRWLVVTGPSGSGKSTLLTVLQAFLRPSAGRYLLDGRDTMQLPAETIRSHIAWCPQEAHLFDSTLRANLLLARSRADAPSAVEMTRVLEQVGLGPLLADLPNGLETTLGSRGLHLSGGQRQRIAIARTLLTGADVLLIDEPTAHLDRESADALLEDLRQGLSGKIVVLVTHHAGDLAMSDVHICL